MNPLWPSGTLLVFEIALVAGLVITHRRKKNLCRTAMRMSAKNFERLNDFGRRLCVPPGSEFRRAELTEHVFALLLASPFISDESPSMYTTKYLREAIRAHEENGRMIEKTELEFDGLIRDWIEETFQPLVPFIAAVSNVLPSTSDGIEARYAKEALPASAGKLERAYRDLLEELHPATAEEKVRSFRDAAQSFDYASQAAFAGSRHSLQA